MHSLHQVHPSNAHRHVVALNYFFYDKPSVTPQSPVPPSLAPYMHDEKGILLIAYHDNTPLACLSMKSLDGETAIIDGLYFALQSDSQLAASMLDEAIVLAQELQFQKIMVKQRLLPQMDVRILGFEGEAQGRCLHCDLFQMAEENQASWCF